MYKGEMPDAVIPKSFASASLLASILDKKFNLSLPLYRQEKALERIEITISRQTMSNWIIKLYDLYFQIFIEHMHKVLNSTLFDNISSKFSQNKYKRHDKKYDFV